VQNPTLISIASQSTLNNPANTFKAYKIGATATAMNLRHWAAARKNLIENSMGYPKPSASWSVD